MHDFTHAEQFKRVVRDSFDATPPEYGTNGDFHWLFARRLVGHAPIQLGQTVLDVATGTAPAALMAAQIVGSHGQVVGVDLSRGILERARQNIAASGLTNIRLQVGDAENLQVPAATLDGILCSSAIVWFPDILGALREWQRVLRPGGWIAFSCFGGPARQTINELMIRLLAAYGISYHELNTPLNSPQKCERLVRMAGFSHITVYTGNEQHFSTDPETSFAQAWGLPARLNIRLSPERIAQLKAAYSAEFMRLAREEDDWNQDYEQFVIGYKNGEQAGNPSSSLITKQ
jgi:protein-L-isoaspartate(D-aspartate) O-methyltransferase